MTIVKVMSGGARIVLGKESMLPARKEIAKNAIIAGGRAVMSGFKQVSEVERLERLSICDRCDYLLRGINRCSKCGCWVAFKSKLKAWRCPIGKW